MKKNEKTELSVEKQNFKKPSEIVTYMNIVSRFGIDADFGACINRYLNNDFDRLSEVFGSPEKLANFAKTFDLTSVEFIEKLNGFDIWDKFIAFSDDEEQDMLRSFDFFLDNLATEPALIKALAKIIVYDVGYSDGGYYNTMKMLSLYWHGADDLIDIDYVAKKFLESHGGYRLNGYSGIVCSWYDDYKLKMVMTVLQLLDAGANLSVDMIAENINYEYVNVRHERLMLYRILKEYKANEKWLKKLKV